ncbi:hypothetical protein [Tabrizicola soli]|uniref:Uncharacterized protein n=1 Tax=Tabrizicola soli TaxID=2185115 RepID=A0ABV7DQ19_9RHOB|nr:hypothetical protein [Tabrizicola soli]
MAKPRISGGFWEHFPADAEYWAFRRPYLLMEAADRRATAIPELRFDAMNDPPEYPGSVA